MKQVKYPKLKAPQVFKAIEGTVLRFTDESLYLKHPDGHITKLPKEG